MRDDVPGQTGRIVEIPFKMRRTEETASDLEQITDSFFTHHSPRARINFFQQVKAGPVSSFLDLLQGRRFHVF